MSQSNLHVHQTHPVSPRMIHSTSMQQLSPTPRVRTIRSPKSRRLPALKQYQTLLRCGLFLTILCLGLAIYTMYTYGFDKKHIIRQENQQDLKHCYDYFDQNRNLQAITKIIQIDSNQPCNLGDTEMILYKWPGSAAGYKTGGKFYVGETESHIPVPSQPGFNANYWKGAKFCMSRALPTTMKRKLKTEACLPKNQIACTTCDCFQNNIDWGTETLAQKKANCPVTGFQLIQKTPGVAPTGYAICIGSQNSQDVSWKDLGAEVYKFFAICEMGNAAKSTYLVDLMVEVAGKPCIDPKAHPKPNGLTDGSIYYLLNEDHAGCPTYTGTDDSLSVLAGNTVGKMTIKQFARANPLMFDLKHLGAEYHEFYENHDDTMYLYGRYKIQLDCTAICSGYENFNFATTTQSMFDTMNGVWYSLKCLMYTSCVLTFIGLVFLLYVICLGKKANQDTYLWMFTFILVVVFTFAVFCWLIWYESSNKFLTVRNQLTQLTGCILDGSWKIIPQLLYDNTNMDAFHTIILVWTILTTVGFALGLCVLCYAMSNLAKNRQKTTYEYAHASDWSHDHGF